MPRSTRRGVKRGGWALALLLALWAGAALAQGSSPLSPTSLPPSGAAGGDLSGTYPNPSLANSNTARSDLGINVNGAVKVTTAGAASQAACADLSNAAASCSTDATNASNISSGTLPAARLTAANIPATSLATGTSISLVAPRQYYVCTGTCTVTPPVPVAGYEFCVFNDDNVATVITLAALGSSARYEATARTSYGTAGTGTLISSGAAADYVCLVGRDSTHYLTTSFKGTWTAS